MVTRTLFRVGWLYKPVLRVLFFYLDAGWLHVCCGGWDDSMYLGVCFIIQGLLCWTVTCMLSGAGMAL